MTDQLVDAAVPAASSPAFEGGHYGPLASNKGFTLWVYKAPVPTAVALQPGFFDAAANPPAVGDIIILAMSDGTSITIAGQPTGASS